MNNWQDLVVLPSTTLESAIDVLDKGGMRIVLVADEEQHLLGTITDGDIRRSLLKHVALDSPVEQIMCARPMVVGKSMAREDVLSLLERNGLLHMPVVDDENYLIGLHTLKDFYSSAKADNIVFLMAGGFGTRLRPLTNDCPKPMLKVGEKPILELILESFIKAGFHRFYISTHYLPEIIRAHFGDGSQWGVSINYVHEKEPLGTAGAIGLLPKDKINAPIFVMNGDLLTDVDFMSLKDFHELNRGIATMCVREYEQQIPYGVIETNGSQITSIVEKPIHKMFVNAGIYMLSEELVHSVEENTVVDMPDLLSAQMDNNKVVGMFPIHEYWLDIGRMNDFQRAQSEYLVG